MQPLKVCPFARMEVEDQMARPMPSALKTRPGMVYTPPSAPEPDEFAVSAMPHPVTDQVGVGVQATDDKSGFERPPKRSASPWPSNSSPAIIAPAIPESPPPPP